MEEDKSDVVIAGYYDEKAGKNHLPKAAVYADQTAFIKDFPELFSSYFLHVPWNKLYRREVIGKGFPTDLDKGEDLVFNLHVFERAGKISVLSESVYQYYNIETGSLSFRFRENAMEIEDRLRSEVEAFYRRCGGKEEAFLDVFYLNSIKNKFYDLMRRSGKTDPQCKEQIKSWLAMPSVQKLYSSKAHFGKKIRYYCFYEASQLPDFNEILPMTGEKSMKKIGFVNFDMSVRGGAQQVLYNMALALRKEYEITIISFIQENEACAYELPEDIHYEVILPYKARIREVITKAGKPFRSFIKKKELDIVFYIGAYAGLCGGIHGRRLKIPRIFCDHGALLNQWNEVPARTMRTVGSRFSDKTVVLTKQSEEAYYDKFHYKKGRVITIYNWIDERIQKAASPYDPNGSKILTAGRFSKEKGMDLLVDTAAALAKKTTDFIWEVYGDGDMFEEITQRIEREGLENNIHLMGLTDHMESCYQGHSMYVLTSYREGLPLVLIEAKANALPLVSFDIVSGPREIIRDGEDGKLIPPYDTEKMARVIYELLKKPEERLRLSNNSQSNLESFSKETILSEWKELIEQFVNPSR